MGPRDLEPEDELPSDDEVELVERIRYDGARTRARRRTLVIASVALLVLIAALALAVRTPRSPQSASTPTDRATAQSEERAEAPASPETEAVVSLPEREQAREAVARPRVVEQRTARAATPDAAEQRSAPAAMPSAAASRPPVRVEVTQTPGDGAVDYSVRVTHPDGTPVTNAAVRLRGVMSDGARVEARLDPAGEPGVYQSLLAFSPRGPHLLTLRVASADGILELPVADPPSGTGAGRP
jgi:hypothetical protein